MESLSILKEFLEQQTGKKVLFDPQPIRSAEPHLRLTFAGAEDRGSTWVQLTFQLGIVGAGDGPDIFLQEIIDLSIAVSRLYSCAKSTTISRGLRTVTIGFPEFSSNTGVFQMNDGAFGETVQWAYVYAEPHWITLTQRLIGGKL